MADNDERAGNYFGKERKSKKIINNYYIYKNPFLYERGFLFLRLNDLTLEIAALYTIYTINTLLYKQIPRKLKPGDIFFALKGPNFNGNTFAAQALEHGAAYAVIDEPEYAAE